MSIHVNVLVSFNFLFCVFSIIEANNLTCYQCVRHSDMECSSQDLKPCAEKHDRCVTHITKTGKYGFTIRRECGLAPCSFDDDMVNKGLGMGQCDKSKDDFFCLFCCKENGCNKNTSKKISISKPLLFTFLILLCKGIGA